MIGSNEKTQVRQLLSTPQWQTVESLANSLCVSIKQNSPIKNTVDETLIEVCLQEGQVKGIRLFIQELYKVASNE